MKRINAKDVMRKIIIERIKGKSLNLKGVTIEGDLDLKRTLIEEDLDLEGTTIKGHLDLRRTVIEENLYLGGATIKKYLYLEKTIIGKDLDLRGTVIEEYLYLKGTTIEGHLDMVDAKANLIYANGSMALAAHLSLQHRIITSPSKLFPQLSQHR